MNLLKGNFSGTLGETYGSSWKNKNVIKSRPFGKAPPTQKQTDAVRAFECLNRVASLFAKTWWKYFNLSDRKMLRHNAVAQMLKPMIQHGIFDLGSFIEIVPVNSNVVMQEPEQLEPSTPIKINFTVSPTFTFPVGTQLHALAVDEHGYCAPPYTMPYSGGEVILSPIVPQERPIYVLSFFSYPSGDKFLLFGGNAIGVKTLQYSLEEQLTNDTWLDGRPIYQRTFTGTVTEKGVLTMLGSLPSGSFTVRLYGVAKAPSGRTNFVVAIDPTATANGNLYSTYISSGGTVYCSVLTDLLPSIFYVTVQYCKP
jgi:hypothetical protein